MFGLVAEVACLHHQRVTLPATAGIAISLANQLVQARTPVERNDAHVVYVLDQDRHVVRCLDDQIGVVVPGGYWRHSVVGDTASPRSEGEPRVRPAADAPCLGSDSRLSGGCQRGQASVRWINNQRCPRTRGHSSLVEPVRVVGADDPRPMRAFRMGRLVSGDGLFLREVLLVAKVAGPLEWRQRGVGPSSAQARIAPRSQRQRPSLFLGSGRGLRILRSALRG